MKTKQFGILVSTICVLATGPLRSAETPPREVVPSTAWTWADYAKHTLQSFHNHAPAKQPLERGSIDSKLLAAAVFFATNEQRVRHKLPPLAHSEALGRAAQKHTHDMAIGGFFAHENPGNPTRRTPWQRMAAEGITHRYCSENIAKTFVRKQTYLSAADTIVAMWMKSPGHRRNLLDPKMRFLGCGVHACACPQFHLFATQNFASAAPN